MNEKAPLLLAENAQAHESTIKKASSLFPEIIRLLSKVKSIGFDGDQDRWQDLVTNGTANLRKEHDRKSQETLAPFGLNTEHIRQTLFPQVVLYDEIEQILASLHSMCDTTLHQHTIGVLPTDLSWITIVDGQPCITPETDAEVREYFRTYIATPEEYALHGSLTALKEAYNAVTKNLAAVSFPARFHSLGSLSNFLQEQEDGTVDVNPQAISWALQLVNKNRK